MRMKLFGMKRVALALLFALELFASTHSAKVVETLNSGGYTYVKVQEGGASYWIAMTQRPVETGSTIQFDEQGWMQNFHSKTLNRTFDRILFASDPMPKEQGRPSLQPDIMESAYKQPGTITVAELFANRERYAGEKVRVRGRVTKTSAQIMKRNWLHLQDGSRFQNADDLVFTSEGILPKEGEIIVAEGIVAEDKDFGYGYFYPVIVENATFTGALKP
ncbi:hypothetical protein [Sulfurimonas sp. HSL3-7]|uniref:hypothetical protein n=1 Tax=Sulfonitrofixus jiaomeiensis TaxID=3131938 RepID=UPI0031F9C14D